MIIVRFEVVWSEGRGFRISFSVLGFGKGLGSWDTACERAAASARLCEGVELVVWISWIGLFPACNAVLCLQMQMTRYFSVVS